MDEVVMGAPLRSLVLAAALVLPVTARADVEHVVSRGHTVEAIANRYRVTPKAIIEANKLSDPKRIRPGDVLRIPQTSAPAAKGKRLENAGARRETAKVARPKSPPSYAARAKTPGVVHLRRAATNEVVHVRVRDVSGRVPRAALTTFSKVMRSASGAAHPVDARLISVLGLVSNHFGSRTIELVSGFRPTSQPREGKHSNHNLGKAIDFRVVGVPNEAVRDFCRTLKNVGCGYYPNSSFVHLDVRQSPAFWVDYSKPGQPPRYNPPGTAEDLRPPDEIDFADPEAAPRPSLREESRASRDSEE
jgi:uncharacterized protein YcbK (DUF882 family)